MSGDAPDLRVYTADGPPTRIPLISNAVLGVSIFIFTEIMLFTGFISGFVISGFFRMRIFVGDRDNYPC